MIVRNLRVLELDGRISDKVLCGGLWNIHKKSEKVLEMALKETKVRFAKKVTSFCISLLSAQTRYFYYKPVSRLHV